MKNAKILIAALLCTSIPAVAQVENKDENQRDTVETVVPAPIENETTEAMPVFTTTTTTTTTTISNVGKSSAEWVKQFQNEIVILRSDISALEIKLSANKGNSDLKAQLKQKKDDLKVAQQNLKTAQLGVKNEIAADKEIAKAKAQVDKLLQQRSKAEEAVTKAEKKVVVAEKEVSVAEQKVAQAQQKVETAKQNVQRAKDDVQKAKDNVAKIIGNSNVNTNVIKMAEEKKIAATNNIAKSVILRANGTSGK